MKAAIFSQGIQQVTGSSKLRTFPVLDWKLVMSCFVSLPAGYAVLICTSSKEIYRRFYLGSFLVIRSLAR